MTWVKAVEYLKGFFYKYAIAFILRAAGVAAGIPTFLATIFLKYVGKKAIADAESAARIADQKKIDDANKQKYVDDILKGKPQDELINDETSLLNSTRPK